MKEVDITLTRRRVLMSTQAVGNTEAGIDFLDAWPYSADSDMYVHDAGIIFVNGDTAKLIEEAAIAVGLTVEHDLIATEKREG